MWIVNDATINGSETGTSFRQALFFKECGFNLHDTMIWAKDGGGAIGSIYSYSQNFEYMFVFSKGTPTAHNIIYDKPNLSYGKDKSGQGRRNADGSHNVEHRKLSAKFSKRNNWWLVVPSKEEGSDFHPAVFPERIVRDHIFSWSNEGDVVFTQMQSMMYINGDITLGLLNMGFRVKEKGFVTIGVNERIEVGETTPRSMFNFLLGGGMTDLTGGMNTLSLTGLGLGATVYTEISGGYSQKVNEHWTIGAKLKVLLELLTNNY